MGTINRSTVVYLNRPSNINLSALCEHNWKLNASGPHELGKQVN
jgi:hypothetical protein